MSEGKARTVEEPARVERPRELSIKTMKHKHIAVIVILSVGLLVLAGCALMKELTNAITGGGRTSADVWTNALVVTNSP